MVISHVKTFLIDTMDILSLEDWSIISFQKMSSHPSITRERKSFAEIFGIDYTNEKLNDL